MAAPKRSSFGTRLLMNFLPKLFATNENHNKREISVESRSICINMKENGGRNACNAVVMLKIEASPGCTVQKASARERIRTKVTSKLELGLNFTVKDDFWFSNDDFCNKPEGKKGDFCRFSMTLRTVISVLVQIQKVTNCKKR